MKSLNYLLIIVLLLLAGVSNAHLVTDVRSINQTLTAGDVFGWEYDPVDFGFVAGRDTLGGAWLELEIRDADYRPGKDWFDQPFVLIHTGFREYIRVGNENWETPLYFNDFVNKFTIGLNVLSHEIWIGKATMQFEFIRGVNVSEPTPFILFVIGLMALGIGRQRYKATATEKS